MPGVWKDSQLFNRMQTLAVTYVYRKQRLFYGTDNMNFNAIGNEFFGGKTQSLPIPTQILASDSINVPEVSH